MTRSRALTVAVVAAVAALVAVLVFRGNDLNRRDRTLRSVLCDLVAQSGATIGKPGTPGYAYYQQHPDELAAARRQNLQYLDRLGCPHR